MYKIRFSQTIKLEFPGNGRQHVLQEEVHFVLREIAIDQLPMVIESIFNQGCKLIGISEEEY